jgi:uncharacterized protein YoxC
MATKKENNVINENINEIINETDNIKNDIKGVDSRLLELTKRVQKLESIIELNKNIKEVKPEINDLLQRDPAEGKVIVQLKQGSLYLINSKTKIIANEIKEISIDDYKSNKDKFKLLKGEVK